jgi:uncharacterized membrane protein
MWVKKLLGDHNREEFIRTLDSIVSVVLQLVTLGVQIFGLHYIMTHPR